MIKISNLRFTPGYDDLAEKLHALETRQNELDASGMPPLETILRIALMNQATSIHLLRPTIGPEGGLTIVTTHEDRTAVWAGQTNKAGLVTAVLIKPDLTNLSHIELDPNRIDRMGHEMRRIPMPESKPTLAAALFHMASDMATNGLFNLAFTSDKLTMSGQPEVAICEGQGLVTGQMAIAQ